jgi:intraflagellar transport protein 122
VAHLSTGRRARIRCGDYVRRVAVYGDRVAVQLPARVAVYALAGGEAGGKAPGALPLSYYDDAGDGGGGGFEAEPLDYRLVADIAAAWECSLLVATAEHLVVCQVWW